MRSDRALCFREGEGESDKRARFEMSLLERKPFKERSLVIEKRFIGERRFIRERRIQLSRIFIHKLKVNCFNTSANIKLDQV